MEDTKTFILLPESDYNELRQLLKEISSALSNFNAGNTLPSIGEWFPESVAQKMLGRKTTWFYNKRNSGELVGKKRGGKWWYSKSEILKFIDS
jgi:hypothetical protein